MYPLVKCNRLKVKPCLAFYTRYLHKAYRDKFQMWHKFKFHFNSNVLSAFFILTAMGFSILLFTIWSVSVKAERIANLKRDENFIMNGITVSLLGSVELDSQGLQSQSQAFMQDYLNYMFEN